MINIRNLTKSSEPRLLGLLYLFLSSLIENTAKDTLLTDIKSNQKHL